MKRGCALLLLSLFLGCATPASEDGLVIPPTQDEFWPERTHYAFAPIPEEVPVRRMRGGVIQVRMPNGDRVRIGNRRVRYDFLGMWAPDVRVATFDGLDWEGEPSATAILHLPSGSLIQRRFTYSMSTPRRNLMLLWSPFGNLELAEIQDDGLHIVMRHVFPELRNLHWDSPDCLNVLLSGDRTESIRRDASGWTHSATPCASS